MRFSPKQPHVYGILYMAREILEGSTEMEKWMETVITDYNVMVDKRTEYFEAHPNWNDRKQPDLDEIRFDDGVRNGYRDMLKMMGYFYDINWKGDRHMTRIFKKEA